MVDFANILSRVPGRSLADIGMDVGTAARIGSPTSYGQARAETENNRWRRAMDIAAFGAAEEDQALKVAEFQWKRLNEQAAAGRQEAAMIRDTMAPYLEGLQPGQRGAYVTRVFGELQALQDTDEDTPDAVASALPGIAANVASSMNLRPPPSASEAAAATRAPTVREFNLPGGMAVERSWDPLAGQWVDVGAPYQRYQTTPSNVIGPVLDKLVAGQQLSAQEQQIYEDWRNQDALSALLQQVVGNYMQEQQGAQAPQGSGLVVGPTAALPRPQTQAEYDALSSGTQYITDSGAIAVKE